MNNNIKNMNIMNMNDIPKNIKTLREAVLILVDKVTDQTFKQQYLENVELAISQEDLEALVNIISNYIQKNPPEHPLLKNMPKSYHKCSLAYILSQVPQLEQIFANSFPPPTRRTKLTKQTNPANPANSANIFSTFLKLDGKQFLIYGKCQSGKCKVIQCIALCHILFSKSSSLIVLDNSSDGANQLKDRSDNFIEDHQKLAREQGFSGNSIEYLYVGTCNDKELEDALSGKTQKMIISIANDTQLSKITNTLDRIESSRFIICIDEADANMCGNDETAFRKKLLSIIDQSKRSYAVTATTFDLLFTQDKIESSNTIIIDPKPGIYKGLRQIELYSLDEKAVPANNNNPFLDNDPSLEPFLEFYTNKTPYGDTFCGSRSVGSVHPIICLIKTTHLNSQQYKLSKLIRESKKLGDFWGTIVYNGKGIAVSHPNITDSMQISGKNGLEQDGEFHFPSLSVKHALQYFYDLRVAGERVSNIAVISGDMADRGISFVSMNYKWHLTMQYFVPAKNSSISSIIQAAGRLNGNFDDDVPLRLFAPDDVCKNLVKGIKIQEEAIKRATKIKGMNLMNSVKELTFNESKLPYGKLGRVNTKFEKETVEKPDTGRPVEDYNKILSKIKAPEFVVKAKKEINKEIHRGVELGMPEKEFKRLTEKMFPKWAKDDTKIARFMKDLDPEKVYTKEEMKAYAKEKGIVDIGQITKTKMGANGHGFGTIIKKTEDTYQLYPSLVESFKKHF